MEKCHQTGSSFSFSIRLLTKLPHLLHILEILGVHGRSHEEMEKKVITEKLDGSYVLSDLPRRTAVGHPMEPYWGS